MRNSRVLGMAVGLFVVIGTAIGSAHGEKAAARDDARRTEGVWTLVRGESDGEPLSEEAVSVARLTIVGDAYTVQLGALGVKKGTQTLDSTTTPKQIDALDAAGPTVGLNHGIYEFDANGDFRVCFAATGKERPTEFATKPGSGCFLHVWRKAESK
jgi:uncharacterized protein (TIGR03067 family)